MQLQRLIKSFINSFLFIVNLILWILNINSVGELITGIEVGTNHHQKLMYGIGSFVQMLINATIIGFIITIYFWIMDKPSIAELLTGLRQKKSNAGFIPGM